jgi:hypothetical protein
LTSLTPGVKPIWAVDQGSGGHGLKQAASDGGSGRRRGWCGGATPASGGANATRRWGAPIVVGVAPGRRRAPGEHRGNLPGRRRRGATARGELTRWRSSSEAEEALGRKETRAKTTGVLLTFMRFDWRAPQRRTGDGRATTRRALCGGRLGLGGGGSVLGIGRRGDRRRLK